MAGYWPFFARLWTSTSPRSINTQKKNQYPAIVTSHLVNNRYIMSIKYSTEQNREIVEEECVDVREFSDTNSET